MNTPPKKEAANTPPKKEAVNTPPKKEAVNTPPKKEAGSMNRCRCHSIFRSGANCSHFRRLTRPKQASILQSLSAFCMCELSRTP